MIILRYLSREVFHTMLVLTLVLLLVMVSNTFVRYLTQAASGSISSGAVINLISFTVPNFIATLLPICLFLAIVLAYGKLFADNELLVMFACGMRWSRLLKITLLIATVVAILVAILSFWLVPKMLSQRDVLKANASSKNQLNMIQPGRFMLLSGGKQVVYIASLNNDKSHMRKLFMFQNGDGASAPKLTLAPWGNAITNSKTGHKSLVLHQGHQYQGVPGKLNYQIVNFDTYTIPFNVKTVSQTDSRVTSMTTENLFKDGSRAAWSELMWRLSQPISVFVICVMGVALCRIRPRSGRFQKILPAVLVFIVYFNLLAASRSWATLGVIPVYIGVWWVHLLFFILAIGVVWNYDGRRWIRREKA